jgi:hypothetical protein
MDSKNHWEDVYRSKAPVAVSWYSAHLDVSLALIVEVVSDQNAAIVDVGGGESTLVDDLLQRGYRNLTVLDVSGVALDTTKKLLLLPETVTVGSTRLGVAPGQLREHDQAQQEPECCIGGHLLVPYEQYTQQSPGFGLTTALQCSHS